MFVFFGRPFKEKKNTDQKKSWQKKINNEMKQKIYKQDSQIKKKKNAEDLIWVCCV